MKKEILLGEAKGKTIENIAYCNPYLSSQLVFTFTDDTFITLACEKDRDDETCVIVPTKLDLFNFGDIELVESGIVSKEEMITLRQIYNNKLQLECDENERRQYEKLKKKYGVPSQERPE